MLDKIIKLFIGSNKQINYDKFEEDLKVLEQEFTKMNGEILNNKKLSVYKYELFTQKILLLFAKLENIVSDLMGETIERKKVYQKLTKRTLIAFVIGLILNIIALFLNPYLIILIYLGVILANFTLISVNKDLSEQKKYELLKFTSIIEIAKKNVKYLERCSDLIDGKYKLFCDELNKKAQSETLIEDLEIANMSICSILDGNEVPLSLELSSTIKKILQMDLNTEEENLDVLIKMARDKMNSETQTLKLKLENK